MCAIIGGVGISREWVQSGLAAMRHRGPDASSAKSLMDGSVIFGHDRLSIIDIEERSNQPFISSCGNYALVFNGEIYNFQSLKSKLAETGVEFVSESDTEVLLQALIAYGQNALPMLVGMFAFAFLDVRRREVLLARDPIGEKPLFYAHTLKGAFVFSSEIAPICSHPEVDTRMSFDAISEYLRFLYVPAPLTMYEGIRELQPGHFMQLRVGNGAAGGPSRFFDLEGEVRRKHTELGGISEHEAIDLVRRRFSDAVRSRLVSDEGVGIFLSGGLDSNAIAAEYAAVGGANLYALTMAYEGGSDESELACQAADFYQIPIETARPSIDGIEESLSWVARTFGQPFGNATALSTYRLARAGSSSRKVFLVGDGGDELFVGYPRHKAFGIHRRLPRLIGSVGSLAASPLELISKHAQSSTWMWRGIDFLRSLGSSSADAFLEWTTYADDQQLSDAGFGVNRTTLREKLSHLIRSNEDLGVGAVSLCDMLSFVPGNLLQCADRAGMAASVELRAPFLDPELVSTVLALPDRIKIDWHSQKPLLRAVVGDRIAPCVREQPKRPFNPPMAGMISRNKRYIRSVLESNASEVRRIVGGEFIDRVISDRFARGRTNDTLIWGLLVLETWLVNEAQGSVS